MKAVLVSWIALAATLAPPSAMQQKAALVTVVSESGGPIRDLATKDFVVKEDGKTLEVSDAHLASGSLSVALLLDTAQPPPGIQTPTSELRSAAAAFVKTVLETNPDARIALWQFANAAIPSADFTSKAADLETPISRLFFGQQTTAVLLEGLEAAGKQLATVRGTRRAIVTVDFDSPEGSPSKMVQPAATSIINSGATLWAVTVRGGNAISSPTREDVLEKMTKATGGRRYSIVAPSGLEGKLKNIAASLTSQYVVTFARASDGPMKPLTFETTRGPKVLATPFMR